jgi:hypothetical protein
MKSVFSARVKCSFSKQKCPSIIPIRLFGSESHPGDCNSLTRSAKPLDRVFSTEKPEAQILLRILIRYRLVDILQEISQQRCCRLETLEQPDSAQDNASKLKRQVTPTALTFRLSARLVMCEPVGHGRIHLHKALPWFLAAE